MARSKSASASSVAGAQIRALRLARGWSLGVLAEKVKLTRGAVSHYELGRVAVPLNRCEDFARAFGVPLSAILPLDHKDAA